MEDCCLGSKVCTSLIFNEKVVLRLFWDCSITSSKVVPQRRKKEYNNNKKQKQDIPKQNRTEIIIIIIVIYIYIYMFVEERNK